jgi:hypothetical protein
VARLYSQLVLVSKIIFLACSECIIGGVRRI